jgi:hypothetical protein
LNIGYAPFLFAMEAHGDRLGLGDIHVSDEPSNYLSGQLQATD